MVIQGKLKKQYLRAMKFFAEKLFTHQMARHIEVRVIFRKNMGEYQGMISVEDYNVLGQPRSFLIEVNKKDTEEEIIKTLAQMMDNYESVI